MEEAMRLNPNGLAGGPGGVRTLDLMTASSCPEVDDKGDKSLNSALSGKLRQNPQPRRNPSPEHVPDNRDDEKGGGA